jgi:hypothetical protein
MRFKLRSERSHTVDKRAVIPNEVRDLTTDDRSRNGLSVLNAIFGRSIAALRMTRLYL